MKIESFIRSAVSFAKLRTAFVLTLLIGLFVVPARAQQVFAPLPENPVAPPVAQEYQSQASETDVFIPASGNSDLQLESEPFRLGIFNFRPHPYYRFLYATGILVTTNQHASTALNQIAPGILLEIGNHWALDYTPTWSFYSDNHFRDTLDHSVTLNGETAYEDWIFGLSQSCVISADSSAETATQTDQRTFVTVLRASYQFNSKISTDMEADQQFNYVDKLQDSHQWSASDWLNYQFWPQLTASIGTGFGYDHVTDNSGLGTNFDMTFEQFQGRVEWRATDKISLQVHAGLEDRQIFNGGSGNLLNPIFDAAIQYQPFEFTKISLTGQRIVSAADLSGEATESTKVSADLNQRLLGRLHLDLNGGYQHISYLAAGNNLSQSRVDDYSFVGVQLSCPFLTRGKKSGTIAVSYQASKDDSSQNGYSFSSSQFGLDVVYRF